MTAFEFTEDQQAIFDSVSRLCARFDAAYWREVDETGNFPEAFVAAMAEGGWLGTAMDGTVRPLMYGVCFWSIVIALSAWTLVQKHGKLPH